MAKSLLIKTIASFLLVAAALIIYPDNTQPGSAASTVQAAGEHKKR